VRRELTRSGAPVEICKRSELFHPNLVVTSDVIMAKIIEFFVPSNFRKKATKWTPPEENGKVIPFTLPQKKSA
jgi:hypothetical protein